MKLVLLSLIVLLAACASPSQEKTRYYLLRSSIPVQSGELDSAPFYAVGRINLATYLDQPELVWETGNGKIHRTPYHQWAEPLRVSLRQFLAAGIGAEAGLPISPDPDYPAASRINVTIDRLHGDANGDAVLVAYWEIEHENDDISRHRFSERRDIERTGYEHLVEAQQALLEQLAREIGDSL